MIFDEDNADCRVPIDTSNFSILRGCSMLSPIIFSPMVGTLIMFIDVHEVVVVFLFLGRSSVIKIITCNSLYIDYFQLANIINSTSYRTITK